MQLVTQRPFPLRRVDSRAAGHGLNRPEPASAAYLPADGRKSDGLRVLRRYPAYGEVRALPLA